MTARMLVVAALAAAVPATPALAAAAVPATPALAAAAPVKEGSVVAARPLKKSLWIPDTTSRAFKLTYRTVDAHGKPALSTGTVFLPKGRAPAGGWPVISWAHGTSGMGDACAPSNMGPALPERDRPYLANWMKEGYAIVASDYAGLGTPGLPAYLNGRSEARSVVDIVKAGRAFAAAKLPATQRLARKWVVIGQSQGAGTAIQTARYATQFGGRGLDYRGAVGTGTPANIEKAVLPIGPKSPPTALPAGLTAYLSYIFASLRWVHPELGIDAALTDTGRTWLGRARTSCIMAFEKELEGVNIGDFFTKPVATLPNFEQTVSDYMGMPESGFDKPFFMGHGLEDTDVPYALTAPYVATLEANGQPVTFKSYPADHSGTLLASQADTHPFVKQLFAGR